MSHLATAIEALDNEINDTYERAKRLEQARDELAGMTWTRWVAVYRDPAPANVTCRISWPVTNDQFAIVDAEPAPPPAEAEAEVEVAASPPLVATPSVPPPAAPPVVPPPAATEPADNFDPDDVDWLHVAAVYKDAVAEGRRPVQAIMDTFGVSRSIAKFWPKVCRNLNLLPPADQPQVDHGPAPHQPIRVTNPRPVAL